MDSLKEGFIDFIQNDDLEMNDIIKFYVGSEERPMIALGKLGSKQTVECEFCKKKHTVGQEYCDSKI